MSKWFVDGFNKKHKYKFSGTKIAGLTKNEVEKLYLHIGKAWGRHTRRNQDLGAADTLEKKKERLRYWLGKNGERDWIKYDLNKKEYSAYQNGKRLIRVKAPNKTSKRKSSKRKSPKRKSSKKYTRADRPSPSESAAKQNVGKRKRGNDGNMYVVKADKNGTKRWYKAN